MKDLSRLLKGSKTIVFVDFEGTQFSQEIIAIGAVKAILDNKNQIKKTFPEFQAYVKAKGEIGNIVKKLTSISENVLKKEGTSFKNALELLEKYVGKQKDVKYLVYGSFDFRLLNQTGKIAEVEEDPFYLNLKNNLIDFGKLFNMYCKSSKGEMLSLLDALKLFKTTPQGTPHNPANDATNLMLLYREFLKQKGVIEEEYKKVLFNHTNYPAPIKKLINDINTNGSATSEALNKYIKDEL